MRYNVTRQLQSVIGYAAFNVAASASVLPATPSYLGQHQGSAADHAAIQEVLDGYTQSVTSGDRLRFESLLLRTDIPFMGVGGGSADESPGALETRNYRGFKAAIFDSGKHFHQQFHNVRIEQDAGLAQVALDFVTTEDGVNGGGYGWKVLQLLKVGGNWKIASEFYTGYPIPVEVSH